MLTTQDVSRFVGGQVEIQNSSLKYLYRGEIATIAVEDKELRVKFAWIAEDLGFPGGLPSDWVNCGDFFEYNPSLEVYTVSIIGSLGTAGGERLYLRHPTLNETAVIFPPEGDKLDRTKVKGFEAVPT